MAKSSLLKRVHCPHCDHHTFWGPEAMLARLREQGRMRRDKSPNIDTIWLLLESILDQVPCEACHQSGLELQDWSDDFDDDLGVKPCQRCKQPIPRERLEALPGTTRCVACQGKPLTPQDESDFCPRCGSHLSVSTSRGAGVTRYVQRCSGCGYVG